MGAVYRYGEDVSAWRCCDDEKTASVRNERMGNHPHGYGYPNQVYTVRAKCTDAAQGI